MRFIRVVLSAIAMVLLASCATTYDLPEKYAGVIGKQYRTRSDAYIWMLSSHQYEFVPYQLSTSEGYKSTRLEFIPAGTIITVKAAKRSYTGGDWDYLVAEVRAPKSGTVYTFEKLLGFSTYFPGDIGKLWEPVETTADANKKFDSEHFYNAPNGRFSIRKDVFSTPPQQWSVTEPPDLGSFSFFFPNGRIVRIDYWNASQQPLASWVGESSEANVHDRTLDGVINFTRAKTGGLNELSLLAKRPSADLGGTMSCAAFRMRIQGGEYAGSYYRGFLAFSQGTDSYVLHYQTGDTFPNDKTAGEFVLGKLIALKDAMVFHPE
jgi:hypothetical protein